jgi:hypothetical protein
LYSEVDKSVGVAENAAGAEERVHYVALFQSDYGGDAKAGVDGLVGVCDRPSVCPHLTQKREEKKHLLI